MNDVIIDGDLIEANEIIYQAELTLKRSNDRIIKAISTIKSIRWMKLFIKWKDELQRDCIWTLKLQIVRKLPNKKKWDFDYIGKRSMKYFIDQYVNGGYSGDDFQGYLYIPIDSKRYLRIRYEM